MRDKASTIASVTDVSMSTHESISLLCRLVHLFAAMLQFQIPIGDREGIVLEYSVINL
jgi:hypothetical protein